MIPDYLWTMTLAVVQLAALCQLYGVRDSAEMLHPDQTEQDHWILWREATAFHNGWLYGVQP